MVRPPGAPAGLTGSQHIRLPGAKPHQVGAWRGSLGLLGYGPCHRICRYGLGGAEQIRLTNSAIFASGRCVARSASLIMPTSSCSSMTGSRLM